jgi:hypothetical protein
MRQCIETMRAVWPASTVPGIAERKRRDDNAMPARGPSQDGIEAVTRQQGPPICRSGTWERDVEVGDGTLRNSR